MARVYVLSGPDLGKSFDVAPGAVLGRAPECALVLRDASISRQHARLDCADGRWSVLDLGSRNGLFLGETKVGRADLADGQEFRLGEVLLRFRAQQVSSAAASPTSPAPAPLEPPKPAPVEEPGEIQLEGEWSEPAPAPVPPRPAAPVATPVATPVPPPAASPPPARSMTLAPSAPTQIRPKPALGGNDRPRGLEQRERGVLQYHKVENRPGFFQADLAQQPWYVKLGVWLLALALCAAAGYGAFRAAAFFKGKVAAPAEDGAGSDAR